MVVDILFTDRDRARRDRRRRRMASAARRGTGRERGGLLGYGVDFSALFRRAAYFVDKILKGAKPGDIPIEQATKFITVVNLKTAKALGLDIPPMLLAAAPTR